MLGANGVVYVEVYYGGAAAPHSADHVIWHNEADGPSDAGLKLTNLPPKTLI